MTHGEALKLLELDDAAAADAQRVRAAQADRQSRLHQQLQATAAEPQRAALARRLQDVDAAAAMLLSRERNSGNVTTRKGIPEVLSHPIASDEHPNWIAATPWNAIRNEASGEFRAPDEAGPARRPARPTAPAAPPSAKPRAAAPTAPPVAAPPPRTAPAPTSPYPATQQARPVVQPSPAPPAAVARREVKPIVASGLREAPGLRPRTTGGGDRPPPTLTLTLPDSLLDEPAITASPRADVPARRAATRLRPLPGGTPPRRWGRRVLSALLLLVIGGTIGAGVWAWREGRLTPLALLTRGPETDGPGFEALEDGADPGPVSTAPAGSTPDPAPPEALSGLDDEQEAELAAAAQRRLASRRGEIEQLGAELTRLAGELGTEASKLPNWRSQLDAAQERARRGALEEAGTRLDQLAQALAGRVSAAQQAIAARGRLGEKAAIRGEGPLTQAAARHLTALAGEAQGMAADAEFAAAAQQWDGAAAARQRLQADLEQVEQARSTAAAEYRRALSALEGLSLADEEAAPIADQLARRAEAVEGRGPAVSAWLNGERDAAALLQALEQTAGSLSGTADRLEEMSKLAAERRSREAELAKIDAELAKVIPSAQHRVALLAPANGAEVATTAPADVAAVAALRGGQWDEALHAYEAGAADAAARLERATNLHDLLTRRSAAAERIEQAAQPALTRLAQQESAFAAHAEAEVEPDQRQAWHDLAVRTAGDREALAALGAIPEIPGELGQLREQVEQSERRAIELGALAAAVPELAEAERRLLLLQQVSEKTGTAGEASIPVPVPMAREARKQLATSADEAAALEPAREVFVAATQTTANAAQAVVEPAADALAGALVALQESYRQRFGDVDLAQAWTPAELPPGIESPATLAAPVGAALAAEVDAATLKRELQAGEVTRAEATLDHIRALDRAVITINALRELADRTDDRGLRPLHHSAAAGRDDEVRSLLALDVTPAPVDQAGHTPLGLALAGSHFDTARLLLESGGRPPAWMEAGQPLLFSFVTSPEALQLLLEHGAPARDFHRGETALHALAWQGNRQQVPASRQVASARILIEAGVDPDARNRAGQVAADLAASLGMRELAEAIREAARRGR